MKILLCINQLTKGGAERVMSNLANYLIENHDVYLVSLRNNGIYYNINKNVKIIQLEKDENSKKNKIFKTFERYKNLKKFLKENKFDIALSFLPEISFMILFLKKNLKVVVSVRNDPKIEYKSLVKKMLMNVLYNKADGFVFQTNEAKNYFSKKIAKKSVVIMNSVGEEFIVNTPYMGTRKKEIISVGRLVEQKNHQMLINAFSKVHSLYPEYKLIIYGDGNLKSKLKKMIIDLNLENYVELPGVENNIKLKLYKSSLFVLSSNYEGMPNALIEALALGVPCISTDCPCGGPRELIVDYDNGFLTEVGNSQMLANKIIDILSGKYNLKTISQNANNITQKINPSIINQQWENYLYNISKSN